MKDLEERNKPWRDRHTPSRSQYKYGGAGGRSSTDSRKSFTDIGESTTTAVVAAAMIDCINFWWMRKKTEELDSPFQTLS